MTFSVASMTSNGKNPMKEVRYFRICTLIILLILGIYPGELGEITRISIYDAYTQVSVFVAFTLLLFFGFEHYLGIDVGKFMNNGGIWQVPTASLLGAMPGCGGAVIAITAFAKGNIRLGAMVAALISTMGDAAFLLLAKEPLTYLKVMIISTTAAIITGWIVDKFHPGELYNSEVNKIKINFIGKLRYRDLIYIIIAFPGLLLGVLQLMQITFPNSDVILYFGISGALFSIFIWSISPINAVSSFNDHPFTRSTEETSFVTVWVIVAYLLYEYSFNLFGFDLTSISDSNLLYIPIIAIVIGFIPGCGPQILVTTLYLNGVIPFAALIGNAISNDGDALFPAIALTPRMAILATLYSAIPAILISYFFLYSDIWI
ncbi:MAG: arsenic efflux protein [Euryarchaeota archaeon]|nr:arsenic efflux protein [Euryarchaeota archaeon]MBT7413329.1 arsenic efflux protein [Euryarchaeota archaeon]